MNTRTFLAASLAALLFPAAAAAQDDPRQDRGNIQDPTTGQADQTLSEEYPWGEPELPPPANPDPAPVDPRVPTVEELDDPMNTPPDPDVPPPDEEQVPRERTDRWSQLDADGDGRVSAEEGRVDADFDASFRMMDTDRDGYIDSTELDRAGAERSRSQGNRSQGAGNRDTEADGRANTGGAVDAGADDQDGGRTRDGNDGGSSGDENDPGQPTDD